MLYDTLCVTCHDDEGQADNPAFYFDVRDLQHTSWGGMASYLTAQMPKGDIYACDDNCARDITAFMATWDIWNSGSSSSSAQATACDGREDSQIYGARLRRLLTAQEYQNTMEDIVGIDFDVRERLPIDDNIDYFNNNFEANLSDNAIDAYLTLAFDISGWAANKNFAGLASCDTNQTSCHETFVREFGEKAFRRPLTDEEVAIALSAANDTRLWDGDNQQAVRLSMMSLLTAQQFLFRSEVGELANDPGPTVTVDIDNLVLGFEESKNINFATKTSSSSVYYVGTSYRKFCADDYGLANTMILEFTGTATPVNGELPILSVKTGSSIAGEFELQEAGDGVYRIYLNSLYCNNMNLRLWQTNYTAGRTLNLSNIRVSTANTNTTITPYEPTEDDVYILSPYEVASFLSYSFAGTTPGATLLAAAAANELQSEQQISAHIERLLSSARGQQRLESFVNQWLGIDIIAKPGLTPKDEMLYPNFDQELRDALLEEVYTLFKHHVLNDAPFDELFDSSIVHANSVLAEYYGLSGAPGNNFTEISAGQHRGGLITTGALMATWAHQDHTSLIIRAKNIRERLMCQYIPEPPVNLDLERAEAEANLHDDWNGGLITARDYFGTLTRSSDCAVCHEKVINPLGFTMEDYGPAGEYRSRDRNNLTVDASGSYFGEHSLYELDETPLDGGKGLGAFLARSAQAERCFTEKVFRFLHATGSSEVSHKGESDAVLSSNESAGYSCAVERAANALESSQNIKDVFKTLGAANLVRLRSERNR